MIVAMKKMTVLVLESHKDRELARLKRLGVLHPSIEVRTSERTAELVALKERCQKAHRLIADGGDVEQDAVPAVGDELVEQAVERAGTMIGLHEQLRGLEEELSEVLAETDRVAPWGEFNPNDIRTLRDRGVDVRLYAMNRKEFSRRRLAGARTIAGGGSKVFFAILGHNPGPNGADTAGLEDAAEFVLPELSLSELQGKSQDIGGRIASLEAEIAEQAAYRDLLERADQEIDRLLENESVRLGMDDAERVSFITGYVPEDAEERVRKTARENGWGLLIREPDPSDEVPTKIRNARWIRTIRPVFNMLGVIPGYRERDISMWFLLFFTVFVGMIIGDAGYGALLFLAAIFGIVSGKRKKGAVSEGIVLLTVLSLSTLGWGAITGNWFGYEPISQIRPFSLAVIPAFNSFDPRSTQSVQRVCFTLAAVHLSIAHLWNFLREIRKKPAVKAFAQLGWLSTVLGLFFLVISLFLGQAMPSYALYMIIGGMAFVFLFSGQSPDTGFFGGIGRGLSNAFTIVFDGIGAFSDIISYIRLFAVGLASVAIAQAFNEMAASVGASPVGYVLAAVILFFGHTLNLVMGGLAVVVHGVRLNLLEFSGHLGMEWTGVEYRPFAESNEHS